MDGELVAKIDGINLMPLNHQHLKLKERHPVPKGSLDKNESANACLSWIRVSGRLGYPNQIIFEGSECFGISIFRFSTLELMEIDPHIAYFEKKISWVNFGPFWGS